MEFEVSIRPSAEKPLLEGSGELADITIVMGRPRSGKSLFLRYLFALLRGDHELAMRTSEEILEDGGWAKLRVGNISLECSKSQEDGESECITPRQREEAYLFYEGVLLTLKYRLTSPESSEIANAMTRLFERVAKYREGKWRYDVVYSYSDRRWYERIDGKLIDFAFASAAVVTVGVLERAFMLDAWLLLDGTLDELFPAEVLYLAGRASSARARLVVATHSPWVRRAFRCHRGVAKSQGMPVGDRSVAAYEFAEGAVREIDLASETYGRAFGRLYAVCE